jgi:hypothetical protein
MHSLKIINASHASSIYKYTKTKLKLLNCNANIDFNKKCLEQNLTPKYAQRKMKVNSHNKTRDIKAIEKFQKTRVKNAIKFWYTKKQYLNKKLYNLHLENALQWKNIWNMTYYNTEAKIEQKIKTKYDTMNSKIKK